MTATAPWCLAALACGAEGATWDVDGVEGTAWSDVDAAKAEAPELGEVRQPIFQGQLVSSLANRSDPRYTAAVGIVRRFPGGIADGSFCSAFKIAPRRFATAAHCLDDWGADPETDLPGGKRVFLTNSAGTETRVEVTAVYRHPSWEADPASSFNGGGGVGGLSYDVAVFEVETEPPGVTTAVLHTGYISDSESSVVIVGYGDDGLNPSRLAKAQTATLSLVSAAAAGYDFRWVGFGTLRLIASEGGAARQALCAGDSGGPAYVLRGSTYEVVGINHSRNASCGSMTAVDPLESTMMRVANVQRWLAEPHNGTATFEGLGFISITSLCLAFSIPGTGTLFRPCEGYDPALHSQLLNLVPESNGRFSVRASGNSLCLDSGGFANCRAGALGQRWRAVRLDDLRHHFINDNGLALTLRPFEIGIYDSTVGSPNEDDPLQQVVFHR